MDTENNNMSTDKPIINEVQDEKMPSKKIKRKATQAELDHPLHGVKLADMLERMVEYYGWKYLSKEVNILCFKHNPTIKVSVKFLRKMTWAREHVEDIYMDMLKEEVYQKELAKKKANNNNNI